VGVLFYVPTVFNKERCYEPLSWWGWSILCVIEANERQRQND
jgi:hypothetical protein